MPNTKSNSKPTREADLDEESQVVESCGNVFADLGLPDPDVLLAKANLVFQIHETIRDRKLSKAKASAILKIDPQKFAELLRGHTVSYSIERLIKYLNRLGRRVEFRVKALDGDHGSSGSSVGIG